MSRQLGLGTGLLAHFLQRNPTIPVKALRRWADVQARFGAVRTYPQAVDSFADLSFLFTSSQANFGLCLLAFDEAAYLYTVASGVRAGRLAEIGRFKGGGTFLLASAMGSGARLDSFDLHVITTLYNGRRAAIPVDGAALDDELRRALDRYPFGARVRLHVEDSTNVALAQGSYDLVFVDGDHSYEGARRDFLHWKDAVKPGGHLLFHDAANSRRLASFSPDLVRLMGEIERDHGSQFRRAGTAGTLVHFQRV